MLRQKCDKITGLLKKMKEVIDRNTDPVNKLLLAGTDLVKKLLLTETLSNVRRCWLAMPLGAGILRWVLACHTIEKKTKI